MRFTKHHHKLILLICYHIRATALYNPEMPPVDLQRPDCSALCKEINNSNCICDPANQEVPSFSQDMEKEMAQLKNQMECFENCISNDGNVPPEDGGNYDNPTYEGVENPQNNPSYEGPVGSGRRWRFRNRVINHPGDNGYFDENIPGTPGNPRSRNYSLYSRSVQNNGYFKSIVNVQTVYPMRKPSQNSIITIRDNITSIITSLVTSMVSSPPMMITKAPVTVTYVKHEKPIVTTLPPLVFQIPTTVYKTAKAETIEKVLPPQIIYQPPVTSTIHHQIEYPPSTIIVSTTLPPIYSTISITAPIQTVTSPPKIVIRVSTSILPGSTVVITTPAIPSTVVVPVVVTEKTQLPPQTLKVPFPVVVTQQVPIFPAETVTVSAPFAPSQPPKLPIESLQPSFNPSQRIPANLRPDQFQKSPQGLYQNNAMGKPSWNSSQGSQPGSILNSNRDQWRDFAQGLNKPYQNPISSGNGNFDNFGNFNFSISANGKNSEVASGIACDCSQYNQKNPKFSWPNNCDCSEQNKLASKARPVFQSGANCDCDHLRNKGMPESQQPCECPSGSKFMNLSLPKLNSNSMIKYLQQPKIESGMAKNENFELCDCNSVDRNRNTGFKHGCDCSSLKHKRQPFPKPIQLQRNNGSECNCNGNVIKPNPSTSLKPECVCPIPDFNANSRSNTNLSMEFNSLSRSKPILDVKSLLLNDKPCDIICLEGRKNNYSGTPLNETMIENAIKNWKTCKESQGMGNCEESESFVPANSNSLLKYPDVIQIHEEENPNNSIETSQGGIQDLLEAEDAGTVPNEVKNQNLQSSLLSNRKSDSKILFASDYIG